MDDKAMDESCAGHLESERLMRESERPRFRMPPQEREALRDWFAGMAMQGMLARTENDYATGSQRAEWAYLQADAMMEAREK